MGYGRGAAAAAALALLASASSCTYCTAIGCGDAARLDVISVADAAMLDAATVEVCILYRCSNVALPPTTPRVPGTGIVVDAEGAVQASVEVWFRSAEQFDVIVGIGPYQTLASGDVYTVTLTAANTSMIAARAWTAQYQRVYPNGEGCDDGCLSAEVTPVEQTARAE